MRNTRPSLSFTKAHTEVFQDIQQVTARRSTFLPSQEIEEERLYSTHIRLLALSQAPQEQWLRPSYKVKHQPVK